MTGGYYIGQEYHGATLGATSYSEALVNAMSDYAVYFQPTSCFQAKADLAEHVYQVNWAKAQPSLTVIQQAYRDTSMKIITFLTTWLNEYCVPKPVETTGPAPITTGPAPIVTNPPIVSDSAYAPVEIADPIIEPESGGMSKTLMYVGLAAAAVFVFTRKQTRRKR